MRPRTQALALALLLSLTSLGCGRKPEATAAASKAAAEAGQDSKAGNAAALPGSASAPLAGPLEVSGTVVETMDTSDYTYLKLKTPIGEVWAAVVKADVKVGAKVKIVQGMQMDGFESKTLKRKFDTIIFGSLDTGAGAPSLPPVEGMAAHDATKPPADGMAAHATKKPEADLGPIKVEKASGTEGKTIAELFSAKAALKDKPVAVRGKVVKYLPGIMGKNWVHLKDGTGSKAKKDDDLAFTTKEKVEVGSVIVVRGTLKIDHDPGTGFAYPVLLEDPKIIK